MDSPQAVELQVDLNASTRFHRDIVPFGTRYERVMESRQAVKAFHGHALPEEGSGNLQFW